MFSKKQLIIIGLILAALFHFAFYFNLYGPKISILQGYLPYILAFASVFILLFIYLGTYWRTDIDGVFTKWAYDLLIIWILICLFRSLLEIRSAKEMMPFFFSNYMAISLFPVLFFIAGINFRYFHSINKILFIYLLLATIPALAFPNYFELQIFLLMPLFYIILTIPLKSVWLSLLVFVITLVVVFLSLSNRAGLLRILISLCIVGAYYIMMYVKINKKIINALVFTILMIPLFSLYLGIKGQSIFQMTLGKNEIEYSQYNPYADTRTFLYYEVFQDLKSNNSFLLGKGMAGGYSSLAFETYNRNMVEVGFLQLLMKTGIIGVFIYCFVIISAIYQALSRSNNLFIKSIGLLLSSYIVLIFIENVIAFNLLNVVIWICVGMCHSSVLRNMEDSEIKKLFVSSFKQSKINS